MEESIKESLIDDYEKKEVTQDLSVKLNKSLKNNRNTMQKTNFTQFSIRYYDKESNSYNNINLIDGNYKEAQLKEDMSSF